MFRPEDESRKPLPLNVSVPAATTVTVLFTIREECTLERLLLEFPPGPQGDLRITPRIRRKGTYEAILTADDAAVTDTYISGDDVAWTLQLGVPLYKGDRLEFLCVNADAVNAHKLFGFAEIDLRGGLYRTEGVVRGG